MRYNNQDIITNKEGIKYYKNKIYPVIPFSETDDYIITTIGDRLDLLAYTYYNDSELYWIIYLANDNLSKGSIYIKPGTQLRVPTNINDIIKQYNEINQNR